MSDNDAGIKQQQEEAFGEVIDTGPFPIRFPLASELDQDEEYVEIKIDGEFQRVRFHDYHKIYQIPGLYETIFYRTLRCNSPEVMVSLLQDVLDEHEFDIQNLRLLDFGAGNGMMAEALQRAGAHHAWGIDILPEAKEASERDRPWVYNDYFVADLTDLDEKTEQALRDADLNGLAVVAALGYGDIPVKAFQTAYNLVGNGGWIAFNIKEDFLRDDDETGFARLIHKMTGKGLIQMEAYRRYTHRLAITGEPLHYIAAIARKLEDIPDEYVEQAARNTTA